MLSGQWFIEATFRIQLRFLNHFLLWLKFGDDSLKTASIPRNFIVLHLEKILEYSFTFFWIIFSVIKVLSDFLEHDFFLWISWMFSSFFLFKGLKVIRSRFHEIDSYSLVCFSIVKNEAQFFFFWPIYSSEFIWKWNWIHRFNK